jgi:pimeloyl-ACP methyl ester carboxylesterase
MKRSGAAGLLAVVLSTVSLVGAAGSGAASPLTTAGATATTSSASSSLDGVRARRPGNSSEARKVDRVPTPQPEWWDCSGVFGAGECATVELPLDYDQPGGETTSVAVLRIPATDQANKTGTLFVNPGGPGGSGVEIAAAASQFLSADVLAHFDVVGFDPRGIAYSDNVRCWANAGQQAAALAGLTGIAFPYTDEQDAAAVTAARAFGQACSSTGASMAGSMSTAEAARDMDVLRRMVGDEKLTYLGFSYGTYLGNVYANMFPDRVRAVVIDGVLDPLAWSNKEATIPSTMRLESGEGASAALDEILTRCAAAGYANCKLASYGDPAGVYGQIVESLKATPLDIKDPETGEVSVTLDYPMLTGALLGDLYGPDAGTRVDADLSYVQELLAPPAESGSEAAARQDAARRALTEKVRAIRAQLDEYEAARAERQAAFGYEFPYPNSAEAFQSVLCTDGRNPRRADQWPGFADQADQTAPGLGPLWTWSSAPCASKTWTVRDEDAYAGPFTTSTANPVLVVGNYWDPATNYQGAVAAASLLPNSRLLSSDSWGHTAYGTSDCVTGAVDAYLLNLALPAEGTVCTGDLQPFTTPLNSEGEAEVPTGARISQAPGGDSVDGGSPEEKATATTAPESATEEPKRLPPVVPPIAGAVPRI